MPPNVATDPFSRLAAIGQRNAVAKSALLKFWSTGFLALATTIGMAFGVEANDAKIHELKPFGDEPISLPGRLEAENYDRGGEGIAFYDNEPLNLGNGKGNLLFDDPQSTFRRDEGVDLSYTKGPRDRFEGDRNLAGRLVAPDSLYLGWVMPGEWIRYTVRVKEAGLYRVSGHVSAKNENSAPRIHFSGNDAETQLTIPHTESAHRWTLAKSLGEVELVAGVQALTLHIGDVRGFNIDWLEFKPVGSMSPKKTVAIESVDFNRHIRPILADNCFECHGPDEHSRKADLRLDTAQGAYEYAIVPGKPDESLLVELMLTHDKSERMPPPKSPRQPTPEQINKIIQWIEEGAPYDEHWAFVPPVRRDLPPVSDAAWPRQPLDAFVLAHLDEKGLAPQPEAAPGVLARRLSLALTGLPAMPEQLRAFEDAYDADPESAISDWTDELLASPGFAEHLAWVWMDAARYADTNGYQADGPRVMWPWRDWLIDALHANMPFDRMTEKMLAGDILAEEEFASADWIEDKKSADLILATGFLRNHRYDTGSGTIPDESKFENAADRTETVGTVWMGLTLQCARCHAHKFDPLQQHEYYQLLSFFDKVPELGSALGGASHPYIRVAEGDQRKQITALKDQRDEAVRKFESARSGLAKALGAWERSLVSTEKPSRNRVTRGMKFRYADKPMHFNGKNKVQKTNKPIALCAGNKEWSISFWFRPNNLTDGAIFSSVHEPERYRPGIQADWIDGKVRVRHVCRWVNSYIEFESVEKLKPGQWYHVTFRCDGRMQGLAYSASLNGSDEAMICTHEVTNDSAGNAGKAPLVLGGSPLLAGFKGQLRDLRFYDREITVDEVASLADARDTAEIAAVPAASRTAKENRTLELAFLESNSLSGPVKDLQRKKFAAEDTLDTAVAKAPTSMVMREVSMAPTRIRPHGTYDVMTDAVYSGTPEVLPPMSAENPDRLHLARWLMEPGHPLTARVAVNRLWQWLWGKGFVDSPENFGIQCAEPEHLELLDWLATEYVRLDWDTKALVKLIVTSRTFRQDSGTSEEAWNLDPDNRQLARGPRYRLPVSTVRDQALALSGRLDETVGGPPVIIDDVLAKDGRIVKLPYEKSDRRRTVYSFWKRNAPHPMLAVFDVADRNQCDVRVRRTNTPLQALVTLNAPDLHASAEDFAKRMRESASGEDEQLVWAWQACTGREPSQRELARMRWTLKKYHEMYEGEEDLAWTALANVLLNLDATLSLE